MKVKLGEVLQADYFTDAGQEVAFDDSVKALKFFQKSFPKGGKVVFGVLSFEQEDLDDLIVWVYIDEKKKHVYSTLPVFCIENIDRYSEVPFLKMEQFIREVCIYWKGAIYASAYTSTGEIAIRKMYRYLNQHDAAKRIENSGNCTVTDIFPVEIYSHSEHRFLCVCWAFYTDTAPDVRQWTPVCLGERDELYRHDDGELTDHIIEVGETAVIGGVTFRLCQTKDFMYFFEKDDEVSPPSQILKIDLTKFKDSKRKVSSFNTEEKIKEFQKKCALKLRNQNKKED